MSDNIKVAIRVRTLIPREKNEKLKEQWEVKDNLIYPIDLNGKKNGDSYAFDHIFDRNYSNENIYKIVVHPVVNAAMSGFNGTIFAYGQTSSGKTYTMMGDRNELGLISIAVKNIFLAIQQAVDRKFLLRVSYMEIYNEKVYDLLDSRNSVTIHENAKVAKDIVVNLKEEYADCPEKVYMAMKMGNKARRIEETSMNEKSSRSHAIFRIIIESSDVKDDKGVVVNVAHLNLVDLAGSERAAQTKATGMRFKEGANINKSLSTLSLVMKQLSESQEFVNFRDSKLTRILQSSLGGNALTAIICAVTPTALEETHSTLAFASRAKIVKNKPRLNEVLTDEAVIIRYALQIKKLKKDLEEAKDQAKFHENIQEKIGRIEQYMIYSSKSTDKKKMNTNRRQTWCAPRNSDDLPVIYETDILKNSTDVLSNIMDSDENLDNEALADDLLDLEVESRNLPCTQRKMHPYALTRSLNFPLKINKPETSKPASPISDNEMEKTNESGIDTKEVVKWLVNETGTPKSVLRDRVSYYDNELKALKELTDQEKEILCIEHDKEMERLQSKITQLENDLECEKSVKNQIESEKNTMHTKNDELKKKNVELSRINFQLQKEQNKNNDAEYMLEMMKEKYKRREKELLEQLTEAWKYQSLPNNSPNESICISSDMATQFDVVKHSGGVSSADVSTQSDGITLVDVTSQSDVIKQIDVATQFEDTKKVDAATQFDDPTFEFNDFTHSNISIQSKNLTESDVTMLLANICDQFDTSSPSKLHLSPELTSKLKDYKNKVDSIKEELISSDYVGPNLSTLNELNKLSEEFSNELNNCSEDMQDLFLTVRSMLQNITYLFTCEKTIKNYELEISKYVNRIAHTQRKELTYEKFVKEQRDEIKDLSNKLLEYMEKAQVLQNQLNLLECDKEEFIKSQEVEINNLKKNSNRDINAKDKEIEELSDKIMEYIDVITRLEEIERDAVNYKKMVESQNNEIKELNNKLASYIAQISSLTEDIEKNQKQLKETHENLLNAIGDRDAFKAKFELHEETIAIYDGKMKEQSELIQIKNIEIESMKQKVIIDEEMKISSKQMNDEIHKLSQDNAQKLNEMTKKSEILEEKVLSYEEQLASKERKIQWYKDELCSKKDLTKQLSNEIELLNEKIITYESHIDALANQIVEQTKTLELQYEELSNMKDQMNKLPNESVYIHKDIAIADKNDLLTYEMQIKNYKLKCKNQATELASLKEKNDCYQSKWENFKTTLNIIQDVLVSKFGEYIKMNEDNKIMTQLISDTLNTIETLKAQIDEKNKDLESSTEILKELVTNVNLEIEQFNLKANKLESNKLLLEQKHYEVSELTCQLSNINQKLEMCKDEIESLTKEKESLEQQNIKCQQSETETNLNIEEQDLCINTLTSKLTDAENHLQLHKSNMGNLKSRVQLYKKQIEEFQKSVIETEKLACEKKNKKETLNQKLIEYQEQHENMINNIESLKKQIESKTNELEQELKLESNKKIIEDLDQETALLCEEILKCEQRIKNYDMDVKIFTKIFTSSNSFLNAIKNKRSWLDNENESLRNTLEQRSQEIVELKNINTSLTNEIHGLTKEKENFAFEKKLDNILNTQKEKHKKLTEALNGYSQKIESCNKTVNLVRSQFEKTQNNLKMREEQLKIVLAKILDHMKPKCEICFDADIETFTKQCNLAFSTNEIKILRHENEECKARVSKIKEKANKRMKDCQYFLFNVRSENEKLKMDELENIALIKTLNEKIQTLQNEVDKNSEENSKFQAKNKTLEEENKQLKKTGNYLQEQTTQKINQLKDYKKHLVFLKNENAELLKSNADYLQLKKNLATTEELLKAAQAALKQLEMEKDNFNTTSRSLEESLENVKFELYTLKNKEKERIKKDKRRSLHDSSRVLTEVEEAAAIDQDDLQNLNNSNEAKQKFNNSNEAKQNQENTQVNPECDRCKERENEYKTQDRCMEIRKLKDEVKSWRKKYDICKNLCIIRKRKIDDLEIEKRRERE